MLPDSEVSIPGIGTFRRVSINENTLFLCLDIQILWNVADPLNYNVYKKMGEMVNT
jgi:hypothetical protein